MKKQKRNSGITLVALVISIIVMLILAGVSLNATIGNNGIITKAMDAKELSIEASEKELLQMEITSEGLQNKDGQNENKIGEELKDRKLGESWKVLVTKDKEYGTNWYYVAKGTVVSNNQKLENDYVINYETGEIKKIETVRYLSDIINAGEEDALRKYDFNR